MSAPSKLTNLTLVAAVAICAFSFSPAAFAQGSLTPPGAPAPTMKTLTQVEPRTPIASAPFTISASGSYYLTANLTVSSGNAITLAASGVTLDLNGFTISSTAPSATGYGIVISSGLRNLTILNGFIQGGVVNNAGTYSGPGFGTGIGYVGGAVPVNVLVSRVSVSGCQGLGIQLTVGDSTVAEFCTVRTVGGYGIVASTIKSSVAVDCGGTAIYGAQVSDSRGESTRYNYGLFATGTALNCIGSNSLGGLGLGASIAQNCTGTSISGVGLSASTAQNCTGTSSSDYGLYAERLAQNCTGITISGSIGLRTYTAQNCVGSNSGSGIGLLANDIAIGCSGYSGSGVGLSAYIANSCRVVSGTTNITHKYNMP